MQPVMVRTMIASRPSSVATSNLRLRAVVFKPLAANNILPILLSPTLISARLAVYSMSEMPQHDEPPSAPTDPLSQLRHSARTPGELYLHAVPTLPIRYESKRQAGLSNTDDTAQLLSLCAVTEQSCVQYVRSVLPFVDTRMYVSNVLCRNLSLSSWQLLRACQTISGP